MESYLNSDTYDLITPDGTLQEITWTPEGKCVGTVLIRGICPGFVGYEIDLSLVEFNLKSVLGQLGVHSQLLQLELDKKNHTAIAHLSLISIGSLAKKVIEELMPGAQIGKLFAKDDRRRVREPHYLTRMFARSDRKGRPLLLLGGMQGSEQLILDQIEGRAIAYLSLLEGTVYYTEAIHGLIPTITQGLCHGMKLRELIRLHQKFDEKGIKQVKKDTLLLVRTLPLHIRTVFAKIAYDLLPPGVFHTSANILQPDTHASGDIYELFGSSEEDVTYIPLEFYTLEPHREHVFFEDRDQLKTSLEDPRTLFQAFKTAPDPQDWRAAVFVVKGKQLAHLQPKDWILREPKRHEFPGLGPRQALMVERYIEKQPCYPFLKAIETGEITSQGVLLSRYFPSPLLKRMLLSSSTQLNLKRIYFQYPSWSNQYFFSHEDLALLSDLHQWGIGVYWVDEITGKILQYAQKPGCDSGMFVPTEKVADFIHSTVFGVYGSNLLEGDFEVELEKLLQGLLHLKQHLNHPKMNPHTPLALVTGGGPGAMEVGNRVAKNLQILSCAYILDFRAKDGAIVNEQKQNPHVEAKMTYRLSKVVERQDQFNLDFPILLKGGVGTDFEFALEMIHRKVGTISAKPIILFGEESYWKEKISSNFKCNLKNKTITGSEWISNCLYCISSADQGLRVYRAFFEGRLAIGKKGLFYPEGFAVVDKTWK